MILPFQTFPIWVQIIYWKLIFDAVFALQPTWKNLELIWQILSSRFNHREQMENNLHK